MSSDGPVPTGPGRAVFLPQAALAPGTGALEGPLALAIGMFDGVHLGHRQVLGAALRAAESSGGHAGVLTFTPHPSRLLRPDQATQLLMPEGVKTYALHRAGLDVVYWQGFDAAFAALDAGAFVAHLCRVFPALRSVHVGENFRFGRGRGGDVAALRTLGAEAGLVVEGVPRRLDALGPISSSRLRECLLAGDLKRVAALRGSPYLALGQVVPGRQLGRQLGFPTLNIPWEPECRPPLGVYCVAARPLGQDPGSAPVERAEADDAAADWLPAIANYGVRPTVESEGAAPRPLLEVHLLKTDGEPTQGWYALHWHTLLRPEQRFPNLAALRAQITADVARARRYWSLD